MLNLSTILYYVLKNPFSRLQVPDRCPATDGGGQAESTTTVLRTFLPLPGSPPLVTDQVCVPLTNIIVLFVLNIFLFSDLLLKHGKTTCLSKF